jgi:hypothetical protein
MFWEELTLPTFFQMFPSTEKDWYRLIIAKKIMDLSDHICVHIPTGTNSYYAATNNKVLHLHHHKYTIFNKKK